jgi:hypothetical protein
MFCLVIPKFCIMSYLLCLMNYSYLLCAHMQDLYELDIHENT